MDNLFRMEVDTENGGYGFTDTLSEFIVDVNIEYDDNEVEKVNDWAKASKDGDEYVSEDGRMHIFNIGKEICTNMNYSDFEWKLCNRLFTDAVFIPKEYSGVKHLIIQGCGGVTYMITIDNMEKVIRVSYPDCQEIYNSYEEAYEKIQNHVRN